MQDSNRECRKIHHLLEETKITPEMFRVWRSKHDDSIRLQLKSLSDYLRTHTPRSLYRLREINKNNISAFERGELYLSRADRFNDPFDSLLFFSERKLQEQIKASLSPEKFKEYFEKRNLKVSLEELKNTQSFVDIFVNEVSSIFPHTVEMLQKNVFIACLSETVVSPVMWAHYSNNHTGFALEYQFSPDSYLPDLYIVENVVNNVAQLKYGWYSLLPVEYSDQRPDGTDLADWYCFCELMSIFSWHKYLPLPHDLLLKTKLSLHKSTAWSYEHEWRLIKTCEWPNEPDDTMDPILAEPTAVYLGARIDRVDKDHLIRIAKKKNIPVYEMYVDYHTPDFTMKYRPALF